MRGVCPVTEQTCPRLCCRKDGYCEVDQPLPKPEADCE